MKSYIKRLCDGSRLWEKILWWIIRLIQAGSIVYFLVIGNFQYALQAFGNLVGMFAWEIMMLFPERTFFRYIKSYVNTPLILGFFAASFGGVALNFYYSIPGYDSFLHIIGGGAFVWIGYEICTAIQLRDKKTCSVAIVLLCSLGLSMLFSNGWELFEFTFDQFFGGDSQHWSLELAIEAGSGVEKGIFDPHTPMRFALMDTMTDMVCNVAGAVIAYIGLRIKPFHHTGKNDVNKIIEKTAE